MNAPIPDHITAQDISDALSADRPQLEIVAGFGANRIPFVIDFDRHRHIWIHGGPESMAGDLVNWIAAGAMNAGWDIEQRISVPFIPADPEAIPEHDREVDDVCLWLSAVEQALIVRTAAEHLFNPWLIYVDGEIGHPRTLDALTRIVKLGALGNAHLLVVTEDEQPAKLHGSFAGVYLSSGPDDLAMDVWADLFGEHNVEQANAVVEGDRSRSVPGLEGFAIAQGRKGIEPFRVARFPRLDDSDEEAPETPSASI